jgi:PEP-CTERM motif
MKVLRFGAVLALTLSAGTAQASLISLNDIVYGANSITRDTTTNLEWLDLTKSTNLSINAIQGGAGGFLANGFTVATLAQVEKLYTDGGWDGVDDSPNQGSVGHFAFVSNIQGLLGVTGFDNVNNVLEPFSEGFALSSIAGLASRPFTEISQNGTAGRVVCTTSGFNTFTDVNLFSGCRMDFNQQFGFVGTYLVRAAAVPEPTSLVLLGTGIAGACARRWRNRRRAASSVA